jgi:MFS family permease
VVVTSDAAGLTSQVMSALRPGTRFQSDVPGRLDRLPWSGWHWRVVIALGVTWLLDGLEVTLVGAIAPTLTDKHTLGLTSTQVGGAATAYLIGAVLGALLFGRLTDTFGRRKLFLVTLAVYLGATLASGFSWSFATFAICRFFTGAGIGGEYSAVNSAIDELIPARLRGHADLAINGTYWLGAALGSVLTLVVLGSGVLPVSLAWRVVFAVGAVIGASILFLRRHLPESPRWLLLHGRVDEAQAVMTEIEGQVEKTTQVPPAPVHASDLIAHGSVSLREIAHVLFKRHRRRSILGFSLMTAQAFAYNGVFFTYALVLSKFYGVPANRIPIYLVPFALGNLLGPLVLGRFFDVFGRRVMIAGTYIGGGVLMALAGLGLAQGWLDAVTQTSVWCVVFFVASAAASSAYLTVSELFPVELRGMAIAVFYAIGTGAGGVVAPALFGALIETGSPERVALAYYIGAGLMVAAGMVAVVLGVSAEGRSLETINTLADVAEPA